jgi:hypothetical protein
MNLFKFILNSDEILGSNIEKYIDIAVKENAPEIYEPREGKVNSNFNKFTSEHLTFMLSYAKELLTNLGYADSLTGKTSAV